MRRPPNVPDADAHHERAGARAQPYGTWRSPITAARVAAQGVRLHSVAAEGDDIYWIEGRPADGGRNVLVRRTPDGRAADVTPAPFNVRTRVHEYGGGACLVHRGVAYFSNFSDQRLYAQPVSAATPVAITPEGPWRYADASADRGRLICVREDHSTAGREPVNAIVSVPCDGSGDVRVLASGQDFYSTPRVSPDGSRLAWLSWNHPQMPWDGTELWVAAIGADGELGRAHCVAGGTSESIYQPGWISGGSLLFASDRTGFWQLYRYDGHIVPVIEAPPAGSEFGRPQWTFGTAVWASAGAAHLFAAYGVAGRWRLGIVDLPSRRIRELPIDLEPQDWLAAAGGRALLVAASARMADAVVLVDPATSAVQVLRAAADDAAAGAAVISAAEAIAFSTAGGRAAHAFYYPPRNPEASAPAGERPPLIAIGHGGPTAGARASLDLKVQFWTSRGFAVVDVNYGGSSGFGRAYRERLNGQWGIVDVDDMVAAVRHLVAEGRADPQRLIIRGGSAGGYTALAALVGHPAVFAAAASYYGVSDLEALAHDTHKFESRYLDTLIGPYPAMRAEYRRRSPIHALDRLSCALILFQGLEDRVVPPAQSESMAEAVRRKGLPVAYLAFEGEQHGFRRAETIVQSLEAELDFYGRVFGFEGAADSI